MITMEHVSFGYGESQETLSQVSMAVASGGVRFAVRGLRLREDHSDETDQRPDPGLYPRLPPGRAGGSRRRGSC